MSAEEFKKFRLKEFKKERARFIKMIISAFVFVVLIVFLIWSINDPESRDYNPVAVQEAIITLIFPFIGITVYFTIMFIHIWKNQKIFEKDE